MATAVRVETSRAATLFHALSDPIRLSVVNCLMAGERCVCELTDELAMAQSRLSWHLKTLVEAGLITGRRDGRWNYYSLNPETFDEAREILARFRPGRRLTVKSTDCC